MLHIGRHDVAEVDAVAGDQRDRGDEQDQGHGEHPLGAPAHPAARGLVGIRLADEVVEVVEVAHPTSVGRQVTDAGPVAGMYAGWWLPRRRHKGGAARMAARPSASLSSAG
jgi:hypothetical protein